MAKYSIVKISFDQTRLRKSITYTLKQSMEIDLSRIEQYEKDINIIQKIPVLFLKAEIKLWRVLLEEQIIRFVDVNEYNTDFTRNILQNHYEKLLEIYDNKSKETLKDIFSKATARSKKKYYKGDLLNSIGNFPLLNK
jgi:hypothetical protein